MTISAISITYAFSIPLASASASYLPWRHGDSCHRTALTRFGRPTWTE